MPKRKLSKTKETLSAIETAIRAGRELTLAEWQEQQAFVASAAINMKDSGVVLIKRRGKWIFREAGKAGADLEEHPDTVAQKKQERDLLTQRAKDMRPSMALKARQQQSKVLQKKVLILLAKYEFLGRGAAKAVAVELDISPEYVRRLRKRQEQT